MITNNVVTNYVSEFDSMLVDEEFSMLTFDRDALFRDFNAYLVFEGINEVSLYNKETIIQILYNYYEDYVNSFAPTHC